jgi:hypothetical protein
LFLSPFSPSNRIIGHNIKYLLTLTNMDTIPRMKVNRIFKRYIRDYFENFNISTGISVSAAITICMYLIYSA